MKECGGFEKSQKNVPRRLVEKSERSDRCELCE